ncbi:MULTISPECIES: exodeoxyribonuclease VII small subunit [unclassified Adlercreutzia]|uniref:exodeoxyribonuclease VII small subunit n=1 Tax=unclassified Adlercreutzia TaxID=2636013 RepID=UPI0013ED28FB|nr:MULTISPECIES: exodeoxyribonuclease VII small subunit [unclassified Adlercreutzia]
MAAQLGTFEEVKGRLEQIVDEVSAEGVTLDEALALYEEAVKLGLAACDLSEQGALEAAAAEEARAAQGAGVEAGAAGADSGEPAGAAEAVASAEGEAAPAADEDAR